MPAEDRYQVDIARDNQKDLLDVLQHICTVVELLPDYWTGSGLI